MRFELSPVFFVLGPFQFRYYGLVFWVTCVLAYGMWIRRMKDAGYPSDTARRYLWIGLAGGLIGARLGEVLFYQPAWYWANPAQIVQIWHGGLSSHGAVLGLVLGLMDYAHKIGTRLCDLTDQFAFSAAVITIGVWIANFLNSEIVGRPTDFPWGIRFVQFSDGGAASRHPTQIYEAILGFGVLLVLEGTNRVWRKSPPTGLLTAVFLVGYFGERFCIESTKEYLTPVDTFLTMGQWLSMPPVFYGLGLLISIVLHRQVGVGRSQGMIHRVTNDI